MTFPPGDELVRLMVLEGGDKSLAAALKRAKESLSISLKENDVAGIRANRKVIRWIEEEQRDRKRLKKADKHE